MRTFGSTAISDLLALGGDERLVLDPRTRRNRYGSGVEPEPGAAEFASTTASTISSAAFDQVAAYFEALAPGRSGQETYRQAAQATREDLARLCGLPSTAAANIVLAPSGTDLHLIAADLARGSGLEPLETVMANPDETGRGVPLAVQSLAFGTGAAHGIPSEIGTLLPGAVAGKIAAIDLRRPDGSPRAAGDVDADFERACRRGLRAGGRVLLVLVDVSKTGLIAPSPACAIDLKQRYGDQLTVLVDACQFRLSPDSLAAYLAADFLVAITGSKFVAGPPFSGALIIPDRSAPRLRTLPLLPALSNYSGREDWPDGFNGRNVLPDLPNFGMLARWRAALCELEAFRSCPAAEIGAFLSRFADQVGAANDDIKGLERVETPPLKRCDGGWDGIATIFSFGVTDGREALGAGRLQALHQRLREPSGCGGSAVRLGQPVTISPDEGHPRAALRLAASAPLIVEAFAALDCGEGVIARAIGALEMTAHRARHS
jgi:selenocysteine lyase/cysteine desulfurase